MVKRQKNQSFEKEKASCKDANTGDEDMSLNSSSSNPPPISDNNDDNSISQNTTSIAKDAALINLDKSADILLSSASLETYVVVADDNALKKQTVIVEDKEQVVEPSNSISKYTVSKNEPADHVKVHRPAIDNDSDFIKANENLKFSDSPTEQLYIEEENKCTEIFEPSVSAIYKTDDHHELPTHHGENNSSQFSNDMLDSAEDAVKMKVKIEEVEVDNKPITDIESHEQDVDINDKEKHDDSYTMNETGETSFSEEEEDDDIYPGRLRRRGSGSSSEEDEKAYDDDFTDTEEEKDNLENKLSAKEIKTEYEKEQLEEEKCHTLDKDAVNAEKDKNNPTVVPKNIRYYMHENRQDEAGETEAVQAARTDRPGMIAECWNHDKYDERKQAPLSTPEIVRRYGYDIRNHKLNEVVDVDVDQQHSEESRPQQDQTFIRKKERNSATTISLSQMDNPSTGTKENPNKQQQTENRPKSDPEVVRSSKRSQPRATNQKPSEQQQQQNKSEDQRNTEVAEEGGHASPRHRRTHIQNEDAHRSLNYSVENQKLQRVKHDDGGYKDKTRQVVTRQLDYSRHQDADDFGGKKELDSRYDVRIKLGNQRQQFQHQDRQFQSNLANRDSHRGVNPQRNSTRHGYSENDSSHRVVNRRPTDLIQPNQNRRAENHDDFEDHRGARKCDFSNEYPPQQSANRRTPFSNDDLRNQLNSRTQQKVYRNQGGGGFNNDDQDQQQTKRSQGYHGGDRSYEHENRSNKLSQRAERGEPFYQGDGKTNMPYKGNGRNNQQENYVNDRFYQNGNRSGNRSYHSERNSGYNQSGGYRPRIHPQNESAKRYDEDDVGEIKIPLFQQQFQDVGRGKRYSTNRSGYVASHSVVSGGFTRSGPIPPPPTSTTKQTNEAPYLASMTRQTNHDNSASQKSPSVHKLPLSPPLVKNQKTPPVQSISSRSPASTPHSEMQLQQRLHQQTEDETAESVNMLSTVLAATNLTPSPVPIAYSPSHQHPQMLEHDLSTQEFYRSINPALVAALLNQQRQQQQQQVFQQQQMVASPTPHQQFPIGPAGDLPTFYDTHSGIPINPHGMTQVFSIPIQQPHSSSSPYQTPEHLLHQQLPQQGPPPAMVARPILGNRPKRSLEVRDPADQSPRLHQQQHVQIN